MPKQLATAQDRAESMLELLLRNGATNIRTHCNVDPIIGLGGVTNKEAEEVAERLAALNIDITSTVPIGKQVIPIPLLDKKGVKVSLGNDSITDHWSPFGTGDMLQKANRLAERFGWSDERSLGKALRFITGGKETLNNEGKRAWPNVGDEASFVLTNATCTAEAVARQTEKHLVVHKGNIVVGSLKEVKLNNLV